VRPAFDIPLRTYPCSLLLPSALAAHALFCLVLLPSGPDTVHKGALRKTWPSTPLTRAGSTRE